MTPTSRNGANQQTSASRRLTGQQGRLRLALVPGLLQDRRDIGIGHETLPALLVPVECDPDGVTGAGNPQLLVETDREVPGTVVTAVTPA